MMRGRQPGFGIAEMLVALVVGALLLSSALLFFRSQVRAFSIGTERTTLLHGSQSAARVLARDLRTAGTNVLGHQPWLVYASADAVAFHADYANNVQDEFAVYHEPHLPAGETRTLSRAQRFTLPTSTFAYPDTTYWAAPGILSPAELIIFWFVPDSTTVRNDDFILYRQVNRAAPEPIARGLLRLENQPFFQFYRTAVDSVGRPILRLVPNAQLPMRHSVPIHLSPADTGAAARIDSVRAVRFNFATTNGRTGVNERRIPRSRMVWLRNGGLATQRTCGSRPIFGSSFTAVATTVDSLPVVRLQWGAAVDESGGEEDVIRYVIWRYLPGNTASDPLLSIPASASALYSHNDQVQPGDSWMYTLAAQDCTPTLSTPVTVGPITVPVP